jgi:3-oxoadipate enol-lactonase
MTSQPAATADPRPDGLHWTLYPADAGQPLVVLLHSLALDGSIWLTALGRLAGRAAVVTVDLRGHGQSPPAETLSIEQMADDVARVVGDLGYDRAVVIGMSLGGCVAQATAIRHPDLVPALGLIDTTAWYGPTALDDWTGRADRAARDGMASMAGFQLDRWFTEPFIAANPATCERLLEVFRRNDLRSYRAACLALGSMDLRSRLSSIEAQTVVVVGDDDQATPVADARQLAENIDGAQLHVLAAGRHLTGVERTDEVFDLLLPLIERN